MFIEVYQIPLEKWNEPALSSENPENRRLIPLHIISRVRYSNKCEGRAEIQLEKDKMITVVGSYDEIVARIEAAVKTGQVARL